MGSRRGWWLLLAGVMLATAACGPGGEDPMETGGLAPIRYDVILRGGRVHDGDGGPPVRADVAVAGDRVAAVGDLSRAAADLELDVSGLEVAPGFINMLSWAVETLLVDGRAASDILQGVTLEVFGEGMSWGPLDDGMKAEMVRRQGDLRYDVAWTTLGEFLEHLERRGTAPNVASFVGATTVRIHELGYEDRPPTAGELGRMQALVRAAMEEGALGVGASLIYAPGFYAETEELIALAAAAAPYGGLYIAHMRSEGDRLLEAVDETVRIAREAGVAAEIYHLKAAGRRNWDKLDAVVERIEAARAEGVRIGADMYTYTAGATGLDAAMPPWVQEGGVEAWIERLRDPGTRARVAAEMERPGDGWENLYRAAGSAEAILLTEFKSDALKRYTGMTLAAVAAERGVPPAETAIDLVIADGSRVGAIYFLMSEDNVRRQIALPWMAFGSDAGAPAPEGVFLGSNPHPRAYGNFARLLGRYVRDEGVITLPEAVRRLTSLPADRLGLADRGRLRPGAHADIVVFDAARVRDVATYQEPHRLAEGMVHVLVNGRRVVADGQITGALPGRVVRGPGWRGAR